MFIFHQIICSCLILAVQARKFRCEQENCQFTTNLKNNLKDHLSTVHEGIKAFKCTVCGDEFSKNCNLKTHTESEHDKIRHNCEFCEATYTRKSNLIDHLKKVHKIEKNMIIAKGIRM